MGACCSDPSAAPGGRNAYNSAHSSRAGNAAPGYYGYSAHEQPATPDFGMGSLFQVQKLLGEGGCGQTWLCRERASGNLYAIKMIKRPIARVVVPMLLHEIQIQARLGDGHINLVNAREVLLSPTYLGLVMEYAAGGNLTQYVSDRWSTVDRRNGLFVDEDEARYFFKQFLCAVEYLHQHRVAHRDLKLDNIVLTDHMPPRIKLCDFGFAKDWDATSNMLTIIGTPVYMAPELIGSRRSGNGYDAPKAELWACGVLLFVMLLGMFPFDHTENPDPNSSQAQVEVWMEQRRGSWRDADRVRGAVRRLSPECCDLLDKIFMVDERRRIDIAGIRCHPWWLIPLSSRFQRATEELLAGQTAIEAQMQPGEYQAPPRDLALEALLARSGGAPSPGDSPLERITLTKQTRLAAVAETPMRTGPSGALTSVPSEQLAAAAAALVAAAAAPAPGSRAGNSAANGRASFEAAAGKRRGSSEVQRTAGAAAFPTVPVLVIPAIMTPSSSARAAEPAAAAVAAAAAAAVNPSSIRLTLQSAHGNGSAGAGGSSSAGDAAYTSIYAQEEEERSRSSSGRARDGSGASSGPPGDVLTPRTTEASPPTRVA